MMTLNQQQITFQLNRQTSL